MKLITFEAANGSKKPEAPKFNGVKANTNGELYDEEIQAYIDRGRMLNLNKVLTAIDITVCDNDEVEIYYHYHKPFERIRRITGYLVGSTDRWNNSKKAELKDRVKHDKN